MKHEIIELHDVQIIGMAKQIVFNEAKEECPNFGACIKNTFTYVIGGIMAQISSRPTTSVA